MERLALLPLTWLAQVLIWTAQRTPYFHLEGYMERWWLRAPNAAKSRWAARIHRILRSDEDRALHDHPWDNASFVLAGGYWEVAPGPYQTWLEAAQAGAFPGAPRDRLVHTDSAQASSHEWIQQHSGNATPLAQRSSMERLGIFWRGPGAFVRRRASTTHRLVLPAGAEAWSLFFTGPKYQEWGFMVAGRGKVHWTQYLAERGKET